MNLLPAAFPLPLVIEALPPAACGGGKQRYVLRAPFAFVSAAFGRLDVPEGAETDFASVPRAVWSYLSPEDPCILYGSIIHDHLYARGGLLAERALSRGECDAILREAMLLCGARSTQAAVVYRILRLFGGSHWAPPDLDP